MKPLKIFTVCGVGMGSSLILRMTVEDVLKEMGVEGSVVATDSSAVRSSGADIILGQAMHTSELQGVAPQVLAIKNFLDKVEIRAALSKAIEQLSAAGKT